ncbi:UNVERIFIED_CONTAM: hypothetical protein FKN15_064527 [Acipenser sinensis]
MKHGQISTKEVSDFIRERATIEEAYARSMTKLAKSASNYSQLGLVGGKMLICYYLLLQKKTKEEVASTLEAVQNIQSITQTLQKSKENYNAKSVEQERLKKEGATQKELEKAGLKTKKATESYKSYVEKYAVAKTDFEQKMSETAQKFQDIEEGHVLQMKEIIQSYSQSIEETHLQIGQTKEEVASTLEAVQNIQSITQTLQKSKENYNAKSVEQERLKKEGATQKELEKAGLKTKKATESYKSYVEKYAVAKTDFEQKMSETAQKFQDIEEGHVLQMKEIIQSYSQSIEETHLQIGQVHNEFVNNMENTTVESLVQKFAETKGTGKERPGPIDFEECNIANVTEGEELVKSRLQASYNNESRRVNSDLLSLDPLFGPPLESSSSSSSLSTSSTVSQPARPTTPQITAVSQPARPTTPLTTAAIVPPPRPTSRPKLSAGKLGGISEIITAVSQPARPTTPLTTAAIVPPPRPTSRPKLSAGKLGGINEIARLFSPPKITNASPPPTAPLARAESTSSISSSTSLTATSNPAVEDDVFIGKLPTFEKRCETPAGISRGPSPVSLGSLDSLPIAAAFTESVNAYFKGADPSKCIVKITGDMTVSFPTGIIKIFTSNPSPPVLSFKLKNTSKLEQILPNQQLLYSDPSQSDSNTQDFWMNMQALTAYLRKMSEQNPSASYYNVDILKYQVVSNGIQSTPLNLATYWKCSPTTTDVRVDYRYNPEGKCFCFCDLGVWQVASNGIQSTPLNLATYWKCSPTTTDVRVDYRYNPESMLTPGILANVQVLVPVDGGVTNMQSLPTAVWNAEQKKALWKLKDISEKSENAGSGSMRAKFELSEGPTNPATLAVQFLSEGSTLSGVEIELVGSGYRLSLTKKRFATGMSQSATEAVF